jgi:predicted transcriptional regulator
MDDDEKEFERTGTVTDTFDICGCYDNGVIAEWIAVMELLDTDDSYYTKIAEKLNLAPNHVHAILHVLDNAGLIEHGSTIRGSWLTDKGRDAIPVIKKILEDE